MLDWDEKTHSIHTSSLHYFEGDPSLRMGRTVFPMGPKVVTDPQVALLFLMNLLIFYSSSSMVMAVISTG